MEDPLQTEYQEVKELLQSRNKQIEDMAAMLEDKRDSIEATKKKQDLLHEAKEEIIMITQKQEIEKIRKEKEKLFAKIMKLERESKHLFDKLQREEPASPTPVDHYNNEIDDLQRRLSSLKVDPEKEDMKQGENEQPRGVSNVSTEVEAEEHKQRLPSISEKPSLQSAAIQEHDPITAKLLSSSSLKESMPKEELKVDDDEQFGLSGYQYEPVFDDHDDDEEDD